MHCLNAAPRIPPAGSLHRPAQAQKRCASRCCSQGFTLAELAIVLVILALLTGSLLVPLSSRIEARNRAQNAAQLRDIEAALTGFAIIHGRLPCPSTETDPDSPQFGLEEAPPCAIASEGRLPWRTLSMPATDTWSSPWRYRVDPRFALAPIQAGTLPTGNLQIHAHDGSRITVSDSPVVALVYSTGPNRRADGRNASYSATSPNYQAGVPTTEFDDTLIWIGRPLLIARLAQAGRL